MLLAATSGLDAECSVRTLVQRPAEKLRTPQPVSASASAPAQAPAGSEQGSEEADEALASAANGLVAACPPSTSGQDEPLLRENDSRFTMFPIE